MPHTETRSTIETQLIINGEERPKVAAVFVKDASIDDMYPLITKGSRYARDTHFWRWRRR